MLLFDTNAMMRYLLQDDKVMADKVEKQLNENVCHIPVEVMAEMVYVLLKVYGVERGIIASTLSDLAEYSKAEDYEVFSFDKKLLKYL